MPRSRAVDAQQKPGLGGSFWRLFASSGVSNLSDGIQVAALPLLAATITRDPLAVSAIASLAFLPWLLFALPAGALVDRVDRRRAMAIANVVRAGLVAALAGTVMAGMAGMPVLYALAFALGCVETVYDSAARAMLPAVVPRRQLERGNSLLTTAESAANIFLGAPLGAWLFALAVVAPFWTNAVVYLAAAALIVTVAGRFTPERVEKTSIRHDMTTALRWLRQHVILRALMVTTGLTGLFHSMVNGIMVLFALEQLHLNEKGFGVLLAVAGVGAVVGSILSPLLTATLGRTNAMGITELVAALGTIVMGLWQHPAVAMVCFALTAGAVSAFNVQIMSVRQALIPDHLFGRVQGAYRTMIWGGIPLGTLAGGIVGRWWGLPAVFVISGILCVLAGLVTWIVLHRNRNAIADAFADDPAGEPDLADSTEK